MNRENERRLQYLADAALQCYVRNLPPAKQLFTQYCELASAHGEPVDPAAFRLACPFCGAFRQASRASRAPKAPYAERSWACHLCGRSTTYPVPTRPHSALLLARRGAPPKTKTATSSLSSSAAARVSNDTISSASVAHQGSESAQPKPATVEPARSKNAHNRKRMRELGLKAMLQKQKSAPAPQMAGLDLNSFMLPHKK